MFKGDISVTLEHLTKILKEWTKDVYVHITMHKGFLFKKLSDLQRKLDLCGSNWLAQEELKVRQDLENVLYIMRNSFGNRKPDLIG